MATKKKSSKSRPTQKPKVKAKAKAKAKVVAKTKPAPKSNSKVKAAKTFKARRQPESPRFQGASPGFTVNDVEKSLVFYRDVLGFTEKERYQRDGKLQGVELLAGNAHFFLSQDDWQKGKDRVKGVGFRVYCVTTQSVDALAREIKARGGKLDQEPADQSWGRDFAVSDPDGFKITIMNEKKS